MKKEFNCFGKTSSEIKAHLKRTRKTRIKETCKKYNTKSYSEASLLEMKEMHDRVQKHLEKIKQKRI